LRQVVVDVPDEMVTLWGSTEAVARGATQALVLDALARHQVSAGKAAELLGVSLWDLHELMAAHNVPTADLSEEELEREFETAGAVLGGNTK